MSSSSASTNGSVAESEDLSRRGIFVRTDELLPVGAVTEIDITLPDGVTFRVFARVAHLLSPSAARALGRHVGMGFEFLDTDGGGLEALSTYLDDLIEELTPPRDLPARPRCWSTSPSRRPRCASASPPRSRPAGFIVELFIDGNEAYVATTSRPPDVLIAAVDMAGMDGLSLVRTLTVHPRTSSVPVVLTSDDPSDLTRLQAFRLGVRDYISKPFLEEELVIRVAPGRGQRAPRQRRVGDVARQPRRDLAGHVAVAARVRAQVRDPGGPARPTRRRACSSPPAGWSRSRRPATARPAIA